jgi:hydrogenase nickel incorporation protein HypA/HybF
VGLKINPMHELGITQNIIAIVSENAQGKKVQRVLLEIGKLSAIMPEAIEFCFDVCAQGTIVEGAILEILEIPGMARCSQCSATFYVDKPFGICECGSLQIEILTGEELKIKEMEVEELCV